MASLLFATKPYVSLYTADANSAAANVAKSYCVLGVAFVASSKFDGLPQW